MKNNKAKQVDGLTIFAYALLALCVTVIIVSGIAIATQVSINNTYFGDNYTTGNTITTGYIKEMRSWVDDSKQEHYEVIVRGKRNDGVIEERVFNVTSTAYNRYNKHDYIEFSEDGAELGVFRENNRKK